MDMELVGKLAEHLKEAKAIMEQLGEKSPTFSLCLLDGLNVNLYDNEIEVIPGELQKEEQTNKNYPVKISKNVSGVKFYKLLNAEEAKKYMPSCPTCGGVCSHG